MSGISISTDLEKQIRCRRTFAIISHPDAGKTTLTEKLLLYGGAIHLAGAVKAKKNQRHTTSDWMDLEKERGISINTTVLQFEYKGNIINLLDTPGHKDFSEDTYRTLTAADAAVMLIDAAKGVEPQTRKLFEVCRMRGIPIFTFINKLDRPSKDPLELLDELEKVLGIRSCPINWPIGTGDRFKGVYDRQSKQILFFHKQALANVKDKAKPEIVSGVHDEKFKALLADDEELYEQLQSELELVEVAGDAFDEKLVSEGKLTPVFFGSAMNNFGVQKFMEDFIRMAPPPAGRKSAENGKTVLPTEKNFSAFVFKLQANMDPMHRDRVAFIRVCSGKFTRNLQVNHGRLKKQIKLARPLQFFGQERVIVEEGWPGDIMGLVDSSDQLRIGDTLSENKDLSYERVPTFSPEKFARVDIKDPMKRKQLQIGLEQLSEEGVVQIYRQRDLGDKDPILAAVGVLQFEVLKHRLKGEYRVDVAIESLPYVHARWAVGKGFDPTLFERREDSRCLLDRDNRDVVLFKSDWALRWASENYKEVEFLTTADG